MTPRRDERRCGTAIAAVWLIAVVALGTACSKGDDQPTVEPIDPADLEEAIESVPVEEPEEEESGGVAELKVQVVEIYFPSAQDDGLVAEAREIFVTAAPGDRAKQIVADLISGPVTDLALRAVPRGTRLRQIYVLENGVAYADFSDDLREGLGLSLIHI